MACLETTFLIDLLRGKPEVNSLKDELDKAKTELTVAAPSLMELWSGACLVGLPKKEKEKIDALFQSLAILPLDERSAKEAGEIEAELVKNGKTITIEDVMIAAIAKVHNETLITRDAHYARIPGLKILKY